MNAIQQQLTSQAEGITCFAWNVDRSMIAVCPNSNEIHIYGVQNRAESWQKLFTLCEHDLLVSSIDWSPRTNKIVSCSHDRNAFVWTFENESETWKPTLVILRIDRAATDVKWSLDGRRFAVASSAKVVPVCMYEAMNDWWVSKMIMKHKSTVLCCAFHPTNGQLLATGSSDFKCRVFSTFDADVDDSVVNSGPFPQPLEFGEVYAEFTASCWVDAVAWSPSGQSLAFASHDCSMHVVTFTPSGPVVRLLRLKTLPLTCLAFLSEKALIGAGHDFSPFVFTASGAKDKNGRLWTLHSSLDDKGNIPPPPPSGSSAVPASGAAAARALFQSKTSRGQGEAAHSQMASTSLHTRAITDISISLGVQTVVTTSSLDGKIILWDLQSTMLTINAATVGLE